MKTIFFRILRLIDKAKKPRAVYAHCDIPCGIYESHTAKTAAETVEKMVKKLMELKMPAFAEASAGKPEEQQAMLAYLNSATRMIAEKEEEAQKCKTELLILWTDYFKPEHLQMFPNLHETFWKAAKLCSKNKQEVNPEAARQLREAVEEIAGMFEKTKK